MLCCAQAAAAAPPVPSPGEDLSKTKRAKTRSPGGTPTLSANLCKGVLTTTPFALLVLLTFAFYEANEMAEHERVVQQKEAVRAPQSMRVVSVEPETLLEVKRVPTGC